MKGISCESENFMNKSYKKKGLKEHIYIVGESIKVYKVPF